MQRKHTLYHNKKYIGNIEMVLVEKESKKSKKQWAGRTDSNKWVVFDKRNTKLKDIVRVKINEARGVTLHGELIQKSEIAA